MTLAQIIVEGLDNIENTVIIVPENDAWFNNIPWLGLSIAFCSLMLIWMVLGRLWRRLRRREPDSLELATWAQSGIFKSTRIFRKYGRTIKRSKIPKAIGEYLEKRINKKQQTEKDELKYLRTEPLHKEQNNAKQT